MIHLAETPVITTSRLTLRAPIQSDWPHWSAFAQSDRAAYIGGPHSEKSAWRAFGHFVGHWVLRGYGSFVFTLRGDDTPIGSAGPWDPQGWPEKEIGWMVWSPTIEGKGLAYEAALATRDYAYTTLGWTTAVSYIEQQNTRSIALAERLGATLDTTADAPGVDDPTRSVLVYRHPTPNAADDSDGGIEAYA